jgi:hypothetical protein
VEFIANLKADSGPAPFGCLHSEEKEPGLASQGLVGW